MQAVRKSHFLCHSMLNPTPEQHHLQEHGEINNDELLPLA